MNTPMHTGWICITGPEPNPARAVPSWEQPSGCNSLFEGWSVTAGMWDISRLLTFPRLPSCVYTLQSLLNDLDLTSAGLTSRLGVAVSRSAKKKVSGLSSWPFGFVYICNVVIHQYSSCKSKFCISNKKTHTKTVTVAQISSNLGTRDIFFPRKSILDH